MYCLLQFGLTTPRGVELEKNVHAAIHQAVEVLNEQADSSARGGEGWRSTNSVKFLWTIQFSPSHGCLSGNKKQKLRCLPSSSTADRTHTSSPQLSWNILATFQRPQQSTDLLLQPASNLCLAEYTAGRPSVALYKLQHAITLCFSAANDLACPGLFSCFASLALSTKLFTTVSCASWLRFA